MSILVKPSPKFSFRVWISFKVCCLRINVQFSDPWDYIEPRWIWTKYTQLWPIWMWPTYDLFKLYFTTNCILRRLHAQTRLFCRYSWHCALVINIRLVVNSRQLHTSPLQQLRSQIQRYGPQIPICIHPPRPNMLFGNRVAPFRPRRRGRRSQNLVPRG